MRTWRKAGLFGALTLVTALAVGAVSFAGEATQNGVTQSADLTVSPTKLPKKKTRTVDPKDVSLNIAVGIRSDDPVNKVPGANRVELDFDKDLTFTTKGVPTCNENTIATLNNQQAKDACKKAFIGSGSAAATCSASEDPPDIPDVKVNAFNGQPQGKNPVILLHTDANLGGNSTITILPGVLTKASSPFGRTLNVTVPPLAGGACSIVDFETTVGKGQINKKYSDYVAGTCRDKKIDMNGRFFFNSNPQGVSQLDPTDSIPCKPKS
ncbi:MAG TPA: hypothetical protein VFY99_04975 [Solirubrobacterales bacterium]